MKPVLSLLPLFVSLAVAPAFAAQVTFNNFSSPTDNDLVNNFQFNGGSV